MIPQARGERLERACVVATLLFAVFIVAVGYGVALPVWPSIVASLAGTSVPVVIARHTALLTGIYVAAPLVVALPCAWLSIRFGRRALKRKMPQNLWWAVRYNVIAFPLAAGVLYPILLGPSIAALATSGSSALAAINALMLKRTKLTGIRRRRATESPVALTPEMAAT